MHDNQIKELQINSEGTKILFKDKQKGLYLYEF